MTRNTLEVLGGFVVIVAAEERNDGKLKDEFGEIDRIFYCFLSPHTSCHNSITNPQRTAQMQDYVYRCGRRRSRTQRPAGCM
jgi:hypothetical protein